MSTFKVTLERVGEVIPIEGADKIEIVKLADMNFQMIAAKGQFKAGDQAVYFPLDSIVPDDVLLDIGLAGRLSGKQRNRVKTKKFLGEISQGVVAVLTDIKRLGLITIFMEGQDLTEALGVVKHDPYVRKTKDGRIVSRFAGKSRPAEVGMYDIEGCQRHTRIMESLMDVPVHITEKLEGSHFSATLWKDGRFVICSRNRELELDKAAIHDWFKIADKIDLKTKLGDIFLLYDKAQYVTVRGEGMGPRWQKNYYNLRGLDIRFFEVEIDGIAVRPVLTAIVLACANLDYVPVISWFTTLRKFIGDKSIIEASHGQSRLNPDKLREGIVIRPLEEMSIPKFGRVILKQRDPIYLSEF